MQTVFKDLNDFKSTLSSDPDLQNAFKNNPVEAGNTIQESPLLTDKWIYRIVVGTLGISILLIIIGVVILMGTKIFTDDKSIPTILTAIGSGAMGALSGLLAPSPKSTK
jgi:hypothetical protein